MADVWVHDKITRESATTHMVAVLGHITDIFGTNTNEWMMPLECNLRLVDKGAVRIQSSNGEPVFYHEWDHRSCVELLANLLQYDFHLCTRVTDRYAIGCSLLHWCILCNIIFVPFSDWCHGLWHGLDNSAKRCGESQRCLWAGCGWQSWSCGPYST